MSVIVHNMLAINAQRQFNIGYKRKNKSMEKLSSGYKVNRAADDAASLSISEKMRNQIRNLNQATNNVEDGIGYVQTADGALSEINNILHRMEELAVNAANDTNTDDDRRSIQNEVDQLRMEMDKIFEDTQFNGRKIWDPKEGATGDQLIVVGYDEVQALNFNSSTSSIQLNDHNKGSVAYSYYTIKVQGTDENDPDNYGFKVQWTGWDGNDYSSNLISWKGVGIGENTSYSTNLAKYLPKTEAYNGIDFNISWTMENNATVEDIVKAIDGVTFSSSVSTSETLTSSSSVKGVSIGTQSINYLAELASGRHMGVFDDDWMTPLLDSNGGSVSSLPSYTSVTENSGWSFKMNLTNVGPVTANATTISYTCNDKDADDENGWWYIRKISNKDYVLTKSYSPSLGNTATLHNLTDVITNAANKVSESGKGISLTKDAESGGTITINFDIKTDGAPVSYGGRSSSTVGTISLYVSVYDTDDEESLMNRVKEAVNDQTVWDFHSKANATATNSVYKPTAKKSIISNPIMDVDPEAIPNMEFYIQSGANAGEDLLIKYKALRASNIGVDNLNMMSHRSASDAMRRIRKAVIIVDEQRSVFGAYQNRMEKTIDANNNYSENLTNSESQIRDTDMAKEMVAYSKDNILTQAAQAMLSQANQANQWVLLLISNS